MGVIVKKTTCSLIIHINFKIVCKRFFYENNQTILKEGEKRIINFFLYELFAISKYIIINK
jgi:hypothetical protein